MTRVDVVVVGSGPNGLAAAVTMARAGLRVTVLEQAETPGGGARTIELMAPGVVHDICSAVHPMALASPFFRDFELARRVDLRVPEISYAQPLRLGVSGVAYRSLERTAAELGRDGPAWFRFFSPILRRMSETVDFTSNQLLRVPRDLLAVTVFGARVVEQGLPGLWNLRFREERAPALLAGVDAHSIGPLPGLAPSGAGLLLAALAHAGGWPVPIGGSQAVADAMIDDLRAHGGSVETSVRVQDLRELGRHGGRADRGGPAAVLLDVAPQGLLSMAADQLPAGYRKALGRFKYGGAAAKVDFVLSAPVPWADAALSQAPTLHLGGPRSEIVAAERDVARGRVARRPYVLLSQPGILDPTRAPAGLSTLWAYSHVPNGNDEDMVEPIIRRIEEYAPGFRDVIVDHHSVSAAGLGVYNPNYVGGDIAAGAVTIRQLLQRPVLSRTPWRTPLPGVYLCSSSTPPGPGVTGMPGFHAARTALRDVFGLGVPDLSPS